MQEFIAQWWLAAAFGVLFGFLALISKKIWARIKNESDEQKLLKEGILAMLHDRLYQSCKYYINRGFMAAEELKNIEYLYNSYHSLGGNGTGTELYNRCKALPLEIKKGGG